MQSLCALIKFIYSEKVTKLLLSYVVSVKSKVKISQILWPSQNIWTLKIHTTSFGNFLAHFLAHRNIVMVWMSHLELKSTTEFNAWWAHKTRSRDQWSQKLSKEPFLLFYISSFYFKSLKASSLAWL